MKITIWLCASEDQTLRYLIQNFSNELNTPIFCPHITLLGSVEMQDATPYLDAVKNVCKKISPLEISLKDISYENLIWRCFYYKAFPKEKLFEYHSLLVEELKEFNPRKDDDFMPHLSLIYDNLNSFQQMDLLEKYQVILKDRTLTFDTIKVIHFKPDDIEDWETLATFKI